MVNIVKYTPFNYSSGSKIFMGYNNVKKFISNSLNKIYTFPINSILLQGKTLWGGDWFI